MSEWLQDFFCQLQPGSELASIAEQLASALSAAIPKDWRDSAVSGFHLAGLSTDRRAEFRYVRNIDDHGVPTRTNYQAREDFNSWDAPVLPAVAFQIYRNGDIRAHVAAWAKIDESLGSLLGTGSFRPLKVADDYVEWVQFKLEVIARFYERFAMESIIGLPIDAFAVPESA